MSRIITLTELRERIELSRNFIFLEALPVKYFQAGHIPGALNLPHDASDDLIHRIVPDKDTEIIVYCASAPCRNSEILAQRLESLGYVNVADYHEGKVEWTAAGLPLEGLDS